MAFCKLSSELLPLQVLEDGTLLLSRRAAVLEQLGLKNSAREGHEESAASAPQSSAKEPQVEVGSILRYPSFMSFVPWSLCPACLLCPSYHIPSPPTQPCVSPQGYLIPLCLIRTRHMT